MPTQAAGRELELAREVQQALSAMPASHKGENVPASVLLGNIDGRPASPSVQLIAIIAATQPIIYS